MKIPNLRIAYVKGEGIFKCYHFEQNGSGVLGSLTHNGSGVLGQNGFFWHPRVDCHTGKSTESF